MKMTFLPLMLLFAVISAGITSCGHTETADEKPAFTTTSDAIVQEFLDDEQAANAKYNDQIVQVSGPVMELSKDNGKVTAIKLSSDEFNIVNATFQEPMDPSAISGESVTIKGVCSGFLGDATSMLPGGTVELKRSAIVTE